MPVTYPNAVKVARMGAVTTQAGATAVLEIGTSAMGTLAARSAFRAGALSH